MADRSIKSSIFFVCCWLFFSLFEGLTMKYFLKHSNYSAVIFLPNLLICMRLDLVLDLNGQFVIKTISLCGASKPLLKRN